MLGEEQIVACFLVCKQLSNDRVGGGGGRGHRISVDTAGSWFKTGDFVKEKLEGLPQDDTGKHRHYHGNRHYSAHAANTTTGCFTGAIEDSRHC